MEPLVWGLCAFTIFATVWMLTGPHNKTWGERAANTWRLLSEGQLVSIKRDRRTTAYGHYGADPRGHEYVHATVLEYLEGQVFCLPKDVAIDAVPGQRVRVEVNGWGRLRVQTVT